MSSIYRTLAVLAMVILASLALRGGVLAQAQVSQLSQVDRLTLQNAMLAVQLSEARLTLIVKQIEDAYPGYRVDLASQTIVLVETKDATK